jgi:hypothetical protein
MNGQWVDNVPRSALMVCGERLVAGATSPESMGIDLFSFNNPAFGRHARVHSYFQLSIQQPLVHPVYHQENAQTTHKTVAQAVP